MSTNTFSEFVPPLVASCPRKNGLKRGEEIVERPTDYHVVVDADKKRHYQHTESDSFNDENINTKVKNIYTCVN